MLTIAPDHADALHLLGLVRAQAGAPEEGVELMARAVAVQPDFALAHYNLGNALRRLGRAEAAARAYGEAIRLKPNSPGALVNLGVTLRGLGRHAQALDAYARALAYQPNDPQIHYNTGVALQELGRLEDAARAYRRAVAMQPDHVDAWANLAAALLSLGQGTEALECCRRRVALEPNAAEAHTALAATWLELGWPEEAAAASRRALALAPEDAVAHAHLGGALRELGQGATALAAYERAVALRPDAAEGWVNLAISLQEAGRADEAKAAVARALALEPGSGAAWSVHGDLKTFARGDPDLNALTALLASADTTGASQEDRLDLEFTLAKALMDMGEANEAFVRLNAANGRKRAALSYDVSEDAREFAAIAGALDGPRLARPMDGGDPSDLAVFIIGMPRSGTTLVEQILASHPQVHGAGELPTLESILIARLGPSLSPTARAQRLAELGPADLTAMGSAYVRKLAELGPGAVRVTDKMPSNFRWAGLIRLMLPNARIIHCRRDPIDTCLSCYSRNFSRGQAFAYDLRDLGLYYRAYYALMDHWRGLLPADRFLEVRYEAVVADLESEARRLIAFCGLDWDAACLAFDQTRRPVRTASVNQVRKPLYRSSVARWKAYEAHLGPLLHALGGAPIP